LKPTVNIYNPESDIEKIKGFTIVVDVFRAFTVSYFISDNNPEKYIVVDNIDLAFSLKNEISGSILIGERNGIKIEGFDYGNSPTEIIKNNFNGKTVIHTTTAGTKGLLRQPINNYVVVGSFVNANALIKYINKKKVNIVNIYCTAQKNDMHGEEDYLFAEYLNDKLQGNKVNYSEIINKLRMGSGKRFSDDGFAPYSDFEYCMELNRFDSILYLKRIENKSYVLLEKMV
jgi:2-phosphosulfolactate phosphatase